MLNRKRVEQGFPMWVLRLPDTANNGKAICLHPLGPCVCAAKSDRISTQNDCSTVRRGRTLLARDSLPTFDLSTPPSPLRRTHHTMLSSARTGASLALRGEFLPETCQFLPDATPFIVRHHHPHHPAQRGLGADRPANSTVRPATSLVPFRAAAAFSSSSQKDAASAVQPHAGYGLARRERKEVPLPSQEGTKGLVQYALYV